MHPPFLSQVGVPFACDAVSLAAGQTWNLMTDAGDLDTAFRPSGTEGYDDLYRDAAGVELYDVTVEAASLRGWCAPSRPRTVLRISASFRCYESC